MKRVKCYGRAKITTVESSFKKNFFGSFDSGGGNNSQEFYNKGSSSFTSVASSSDYTNINSRELFASDTDSFDGSLSNYSSCSSGKIKRKNKSNKTGHLSKFSYSNASLKKHIGLSKSCAKHKISKQFKPLAKKTASCSSYRDPGLSCLKSKSKSGKRLKSCKKDTLKKNRKISQRLRLDKHSAIPIRSSCSDFCENPSFVINTGIKKQNKKGGAKKKQLVIENNDLSASYCFSKNIVPTFESKSDSFWAAIQPRWSSICEHSLEIEKGLKRSEKTVHKLFEQPVIENVSRVDLIEENEQFPRDGCVPSGISFQSKGSSSCKYPLAVEKYKSTDEVYTARSGNFSSHGSNLNVKSAATVEGKLEAVGDISKNLDVSKNSQIIPEVEYSEVLQTSDEVASIISDLNEIVHEELNVTASVSVNEGENTSRTKDKSIETCREETESNEEFATARQTNFTARKTASENESIFKRNKEKECFSENGDQLQHYVSDLSSKQSKGFYSSTPLASPFTHATAAKKFPSGRAFSRVSQKDLFISSTPLSSQAVRSQQNQLCNVSKISCLRRQCSLLHNLSSDSSIKLQKYPSTKNHSSMLLRKNKSCASFINRTTQRIQNSHHHTRSWQSNSRREHSSLGGNQGSIKSYSLSKQSLQEDFGSLLANTTSEDSLHDVESLQCKLLKFCSQTRIIPFDELYEWSNIKLKKIGEGTYGEVFTLCQNKIQSVVKVIPFSEDNDNNNMQSIESVLSEVTVSKCLSELRSNKTNKTKNFNKLKSVHVVRGCYPDQMLVAWDNFALDRTSYNDRPDCYTDLQMYVIIELEYGGKDMTCFILRNGREALSVLKQIAISLAIAEEVHLFEHRDLHLGNILVQRNKSKTISYVLGGKAFSIPNYGLQVTIIDFTFSRVLHEGCIFYKDLADDHSLFDQTGDYQFKVYKDTREHLQNEWHQCLLYSNVLWLMYMCVKLLEYEYSRPSSKIHEEGLNNIRTFKEKLRNCQNAFECLTTWNILSSDFKTERGSAKKMAMKAKLIDRNSLQKSTSRCISLAP